MKKLTTSELAWTQTLKAARAAVRLRYSLMADTALNEILPQLHLEFNKALLSGQPYELDTASLMGRLDEDQS